MTFVRVTQTDIPSIIAFLNVHADYTMFPLSNLARFALDGEENLAPRMWMKKIDTITDVLTVSKAGMVLPYLPSGDFEGAARCLSRRTLIGINGAAQSALGMQNALGLGHGAVDMVLDTDEIHFALELAQLKIPDGSTHLVTLSEATRAIVTEWMIDYDVNTLGMTLGTAKATVPDKINVMMTRGNRVVLMDGTTPVATTAFNASLPHMVQIGGVYTPPDHRGCGHARRAVALHLHEARAQGATRAVLFADHPSAIAAYRSVGFTEIGKWHLAVFKTPQVAP